MTIFTGLNFREILILVLYLGPDLAIINVEGSRRLQVPTGDFFSVSLTKAQLQFEVWSEFK